MAADTKALSRRMWRQTLLFTPVLAALLFTPAGTLQYWPAWLLAAVFITATSAMGVYFLKHDPALLERRMKAGPGAEQEPAQKIIIAIAMIGTILLVTLPGLDFRWHGLSMPPWLVLLANAAVALSFVIFFFVMKQNSYAASTIKVEADQPVVSTGLYSVVRHPMYAGALLLVATTPLALGSYRTLPLAGLIVPVLAWRLLDEERFLARNLPGYADYCASVRYRLIPGVW